MKKLFSILLLLPALCFGATATFSPDTTTDFANPERGWYFYAAINGGGLFASPSTWISEVNGIVKNSYIPSQPSPSTLAFGVTVLDSSSDTIPSSSLANMATNLAYLRTAGAKAIIRFKYGDSDSATRAPSLARMQAHMRQLAPILTTYRDVIYTVQAGFIGNYGEWWFSSTGSSSSDLDSKSTRTAVEQGVLAMVPPEIPVGITCIYCEQEFWFPTALNVTAAFQGSAWSRVGFHNDCIMASANDQFQFPGSFSAVDFTVNNSAASQRAYAAAQAEFTPYGGETCAGSAQRLACTGGTDNAGLAGGILNEGPRYHIAYLGRAYYQAFMDAWSSGGCYGNVSTLLGYRIQYDSLSHPDSVAHGTTMLVTLNLHNYGWSRIFLERRVKVTLSQAGAADINCTSADDLRQLPSQATTPSTIRVRCAIPSSAALGTYAVSLSMPDKTPALSTVRAFVVRPANANSGGQVWNDSTGRFATGTSVVVN